MLQTEIAKRLNAICAQVIPFLSQEVRKLCFKHTRVNVTLTSYKKTPFPASRLNLVMIIRYLINNIKMWLYKLMSFYLHKAAIFSLLLERIL